MANNVKAAERAARQIERQVKQFTGPRMIRIVNEAIRALRDLIKTRHMGGAGTGPKRLARNTGKMEERTTATRAKVSGAGDVSASIRINVPYANIHFSEDGRTRTVIRPKTRQALAIPLPGIKGPNKRAMFAPRSREITGKYAENGVLYGVLPGKWSRKPLFLLRQSVVVPARISVARDIQPEGERILTEIIEREAKKIFGA